MSNIEEIPAVNKLRALTGQSIDQKILAYFEEYKKFFLNAINHRALDGHYYYIFEPENAEWMGQAEVTALNLLCDRFIEQGYRVEKRTSQRYNSNFVEMNKITIYWN